MMQLHLTIPVFICLAASCYCQPAHYYGHGLPRVKQTVFTDQMKDGSSHIMVNRAQGPLRAIIGKGAANYLLKGAKYKRIDASGYRLFEKEGQFKTALKYFNAVNPTNMNAQNLGRSGNVRRKMKVGDRKIQLLHNDNDVGYRGLPQILISNPTPGELPYKIIFKKTLH